MLLWYQCLATGQAYSSQSGGYVCYGNQAAALTFSISMVCTLSKPPLGLTILSEGPKCTFSNQKGKKQKTKQKPPKQQLGIRAISNAYDSANFRTFKDSSNP